MKKARYPMTIALSLMMIAPAVAWADPPIAVDPTLTDAALLRYQYTEGSSDTYRMELGQQMIMSGAGLPDGAQTDMTMLMDTLQTVQSVDEQGNGMMQQTIGNTTVTMSVNGQQVPAVEIGEMLNGLSITMQLSPRGEVLDTQIGEVPDPAMAEMLTMLEDSFSQMTLELPEEQVTVGQSWTQELPFDMDQAGLNLDTSTTATYTFLGYAMVDGRQIVVLESDINLGMSGTFSEGGMSATAEGTGSGHGYTYFDNALGKLHSGVMDMTLNMRITGEGITMDQQMNMSVNISQLAGDGSSDTQ